MTFQDSLPNRVAKWIRGLVSGVRHIGAQRQRIVPLALVAVALGMATWLPAYANDARHPEQVSPAALSSVSDTIVLFGPAVFATTEARHCTLTPSA